MGESYTRYEKINILPEKKSSFKIPWSGPGGDLACAFSSGSKVIGIIGVAGSGGGFELGKGLSKFVIIEMYPSLHGVPSVHGDPVSSSPLGVAGFGGGGGHGMVRPLLVVSWPIDGSVFVDCGGGNECFS